MNHEISLVLFTVLTQLAVGLALFAAWKTLRSPAGATLPDSERAAQAAWHKKDWMAVFVLAAVGLIASMFHLAQPLRAVEALGNLSVSWLSREGLVFGLFVILALVNVFCPNRAFAVLAALAGLAGIVAQGFTYAPIAMPAISNGVPMLLFLLSSLAMGAAAAQVNGSHNFGAALRVVSAALVLLLLVVPCLWTSGGPVMQATAALWMRSWLFWAGLALIAAGFFLAPRAGQRSVAPVLVAVLGGVVLTRLVFFGGTVHTAMNLGMPY